MLLASRRAEERLPGEPGWLAVSDSERPADADGHSTDANYSQWLAG
jgi:hypothetical protein